MHPSGTPRGIARLDRRVVQSACLLAGVLIIAFWATWFIDRDLLASEHRSEYFTFENAFPLADAWLVFCCLAAFRALLTRRPSALLWLVAAGSAAVFLTGMDVLYDLTNGVYTRGGPAVIELVLNVLTATLAVVTLTWGWARRVELLGCASGKLESTTFEPSSAASPRKNSVSPPR